MTASPKQFLPNTEAIYEARRTGINTILSGERSQTAEADEFATCDIRDLTNKDPKHLSPADEAKIRADCRRLGLFPERPAGFRLAQGHYPRSIELQVDGLSAAKIFEARRAQASKP